MFLSPGSLRLDSSSGVNAAHHCQGGRRVMVGRHVYHLAVVVVVGTCMMADWRIVGNDEGLQPSIIID